MDRSTARRTLFALALAAALAPSSPAAAADPPTARHPDAPPELEQFAFLIGAWNCTSSSLRPDGSTVEGRARWEGRWTLGGWAIQDDWYAPWPGPTGRGFNIRSFNPQSGKWDNHWLDTRTLQWKVFEAEKVGETMVMIGGRGTDPFGDFVDRNVFYDIGPDAWRWRKDRSYDGGETWIEGVAHIRAVRAPASVAGGGGGGA